MMFQVGQPKEVDDLVYGGKLKGGFFLEARFSFSLVIALCNFHFFGQKITFWTFWPLGGTEMSRNKYLGCMWNLTLQGSSK